ncbi:MAG: hypothetical protein J5847_01250 [Clostridia bacterium]|nr:hypothetical protein [Clostridia bacterium]
MAKQTKEQKGQTLVTMSFAAGLAAFMAAYSGAVLKKGFLSSFFTMLAGAMVFLTAKFTQEDTDG